MNRTLALCSRTLVTNRDFCSVILRAFADYMIDVANEQGCFDSDVVMVKQVPGVGPDRLAAQGGTYHVILQGKRDGQIVDEVRTVTAVRGTVNPYTDYDAYQHWLGWTACAS